ncbi:MAG: contractile injection system tape measure protein [Pseudomonadota bacterium]
MQTRHLIDTAVFDISFSDEETAFQTQSELEVFLKRQMMGVVDQVFDAASEAGFVMRIPSLEIDLGSVAYDDYQDELPKRLRERLTGLLKEFRVSTSGRSASNASVIDRRQAEYHQLEYFLLNGHLPWYSSLDDDVVLDGLLERALSDNAARLKNLLQTTPHRHLVVARLVSQFSSASIVQLFYLLAPYHAPVVNELMDMLILAWRGNSMIVDALGLRHEDAVAQLWLFLIEIILGNDGHQYSAQELMAQALQSMLFEKYRISRKTMTAFLAQTDAASSSAVHVVMQRLMQERSDQDQQLNRKVASEREGLQTLDNFTSDDIGLSEKEALQAMLVRVIVSGDTSAIASSWDEMLSKHDSLLVQLLRQYGQQAQVRKRLAYGFSEAQLRDILEMVEPLEHAFVTQVIAQHASLRPKQAGQVQSPKRTLRMMWEFSLGYLLVERGSRFNKKSYLASLLRQLAASENMDFQALLNDLLKNLGSGGMDRNAGRQMCQLLLELKEEPGVKDEQAGAAECPELRAYDLYSQLYQALVDGQTLTKGDQAGLVKVIDELQHDYPWQLLRVLRELQSGAISGSSAQSGLSTPLLRQLILALLDLTNQSGSELQHAVIVNAERSMDQSQYFRELFNCLVKDKPIDFEALCAGANQNNGKSTDRTIDALSNLAVSNVLPDNQLEGRLKQFLCGEIELSTTEKISLIRGITRLFARQPQRFMNLILSVDTKQQQISRLVILLPDRLLAGIVTGLAGVPSRRLLQSAELMTTACLGCQIGVKPELMRQIKWEYIFTYLINTGRLFNEQRFIRGYVESLTKQIRQDGLQQFQASLCQQLVVNLLPSTQDASQRIIDLLLEPVDPQAAQQAAPNELIDEAETAEIQDSGAQEEIYISNAGIVLTAPYLPSLFARLGLTKNSTFKDRQAELRAVHLLQYLVNEKSASPEYQLFLNKLLCGLNNAEPIPREIVLIEQEKDLLDGLLQGMIDNWKVLGNTSLAGLREAFMQRQGRLQLRDDAWRLQVESKAFDMLLDQIPWGFSTIKYPWMERVIYVEWR